MSHPLDKLAATNIRVLVERCSDNAEAMGSNPVEALNIFFGLKFKIAWIAMIKYPFHLYSSSSNQLHLKKILSVNIFKTLRSLL